MFLIDDLLMMPVRGLFSVFEELHEQVRGEGEHTRASARDRLTKLYMQLETGQITPEEFDAAEEELVAIMEEPEPRREAGGRADGTSPERRRKP